MRFRSTFGACYGKDDVNIAPSRQSWRESRERVLRAHASGWRCRRSDHVISLPDLPRREPYTSRSRLDCGCDGRGRLHACTILCARRTGACGYVTRRPRAPAAIGAMLAGVLSGGGGPEPPAEKTSPSSRPSLIATPNHFSGTRCSPDAAGHSSSGADIPLCATQGRRAPGAHSRSPGGGHNMLMLGRWGGPPGTHRCWPRGSPRSPARLTPRGSWKSL